MGGSACIKERDYPRSVWGGGREAHSHDLTEPSGGEVGDIDACIDAGAEWRGVCVGLCVAAGKAD